MPDTETREVRVLPAEQIELRIERRENGPPVMSGYAAVFNRDSVDMGFIEQIAPGAFTEALDRSDVRCLFNHDSNQVLGRSKAKTLRLKQDDKGLRFEVDLPDTQLGRDLATSVERGDIDGCSFAFTVAENTWTYDADPVRRTINKVGELYDVGPVTYPAYPDTSVAMRSLDQARAVASQKARADRLMAVLKRARHNPRF